eukprot:3976030-Pyramimonas_sp.AAC.1
MVTEKWKNTNDGSCRGTWEAKVMVTLSGSSLTAYSDLELRCHRTKVPLRTDGIAFVLSRWAPTWMPPVPFSRNAFKGAVMATL